jgi:hypothetical protein
MFKKILHIKKSPIRLIYEGLYGTTIGPKDEVSYIVSCLRETSKILGSHLYKKIFPEEKWYIS